VEWNTPKTEEKQGKEVEASGCAERPVGDSSGTSSHGTNISEMTFIDEIFLASRGLAMNARENAENCTELAENATDAPSKRRFERLADSWKVMAETQDWLDGKMPTDSLAEK
jgi:hypothetical protein